MGMEDPEDMEEAKRNFHQQYSDISIRIEEVSEDKHLVEPDYY